MTGREMFDQLDLLKSPACLEPPREIGAMAGITQKE
jgi:hypothetical protein